MDADDTDVLLKTREGDALSPAVCQVLSPWNIDGVMDHLDTMASAEQDDLTHPSAGPPLICCFRWCLYRATSHDKYS